LYLDKSNLSPGEGPSLMLNKELFLSSDKEPYLLLDSKSFLTNELLSENKYSLNNTHFLNEELSNILHIFTQNKRKLSKLPNINTKKRSKPGKSWEKNLLLNNKNIFALDPIFNDTMTRWNSIYLLLEHLLYLYKAIKRLQKDFAKDKERTIKQNSKALEELLLEEEDLLRIQELVKLLSPFAYVITIMGSDQYSTFSMILSLIRILQDHLFENEMILKHSIVRDVRNEIELSFGNH
ncbi:1121_t:CDS:2, partial [Dentiscutata heterogama]